MAAVGGDGGCALLGYSKVSEKATEQGPHSAVTKQGQVPQAKVRVRGGHG